MSRTFAPPFASPRRRAAAAVRRAGRRLGWPDRRVEPPRGAVHRDPAAGRRDRLLHVPQLRAGPRGLRDARRQLPAAAGPVRRPQLLQARSERRLRDPRRPTTATRSRTSRSSSGSRTTNDDNKFNVGGKMVSIPLVQNGSGDVATPNSPALNVHETYTLDVIRGPRRTGAAQPVTNLDAGRHDVRQAGRLHRHQDDRATTSRTPTSTSTTSAFPGCRQRPRVRRPAQGPVRREPRRDLRPRQHQVSGGGAQPARRVRDRRLARRRERHVAGARGADRVPHRRQGHDHRRLDDGERARRRARCSATPGSGLDPTTQTRQPRAGLAPRHAARQRGRHRPQGQEQVQRERAEGRRRSSPTT